MKILLTGALGFIGKNFILDRPKNWQIFALDIIEDKKFEKKILNLPAGKAGTHFYKIDLSDNKAVKYFAKQMPKFDICLHLAANGDPALSTPDPLWDLQATTETLINVLTSFDIFKFIYLSSGAVYDGNTDLVSEKTYINPTLPYSISHKAAEDYVRFFAKSGKIKNYVILRFFGAYGPFEPPRKIYTKLVNAFGINKNSDLSLRGVLTTKQSTMDCRGHSNGLAMTKTNIIQRSDFTIRGDGKNLIDAMYVEDAIRGFQKVILSNKTNLTVDFCKGDHPTIDTLVREAAQILNITVKIKHQGQVPECNNFYASPKKFQEIFHFKPEISLEEGIVRLKEHLEKSEIRNPKS